MQEKVNHSYHLRNEVTGTNFEISSICLENSNILFKCSSFILGETALSSRD